MRAKKSLGQNFLRSTAVAKKLADSANIAPDDIVIEVGPGKGIITEMLLQKVKKVIAVEKDTRMIEYLKEKFSNEIYSKKLILVHEDILNFNQQSYTLVAGDYKLIGSIPYYITGVFLRKFLSASIQPCTIALIIQKEVAERIVARDKKESILSVSIKTYGKPRFIQKVSRKLFSPEPNVDSAIITIENISRNFFSDISEDVFFKLVKAGFASKRKKVLSNIKKQFPGINWEKVFTDVHISQNARAENLTPEHWHSLAKIYPPND